MAAMQAYVPSQYMVGWHFFDGKGTTKDTVTAHMWFNIAGSNGHDTAHKAKAFIEQDMTSAEISIAQKLATECLNSNYKRCGRN